MGILELQKKEMHTVDTVAISKRPRFCVGVSRVGREAILFFNTLETAPDTVIITLCCYDNTYKRHT